MSLWVLTNLIDLLLLCAHLVGIRIVFIHKMVILRWYWVVSRVLCANVLSGHRIGTWVLNAHVGLCAHLVSILHWQWIRTSHVLSGHRIGTLVLNVRAVLSAHSVSILIRLHKGLVLHWRMRWDWHLKLIAHDRLAEMESLMIDQLFLLLLVLDEVLRDATVLRD